MKKAIIVLLGVGLFAGIFIYSMDWGTVESEIEKSELTTDELQIRERTTFVDLNGMDVGSYTASSIDDKLELLFNIDGLKKTTGRFNDVVVALNVADNVDSSYLKVSIRTESIFTNNTNRDESLMSDEYFNVAKYPRIFFESDNIVRGDSSLLANGLLNFMGNDKELSIPLVILGQGLNSEDQAFTAFEGQFDFDRTQYGMIEEKGIGNIVHISFYCELVSE